MTRTRRYRSNIIRRQSVVASVLRRRSRPERSSAISGFSGLVEELRGTAERSGDVANRVAHLERHQILGRLANRLDDQRDRACLGVGVGDRQRDPLGAGPQANDDELAGLPDLGEAGRLDDEARDVR